MVSGVDSPSPQNQLVEATTNVAAINQAKQGVVLNSSQLVIGKQVQAEVVASLSDGTYIVKVADVVARMQLPNAPQVGAKLPLTLIASTPRATFLLNSSNAAGNTPITTQATLGENVQQLIDDFNQANNAGVTPKLYLQNSASVANVANQTDPRLLQLTSELPDGAPATLSMTGKLINQLVQAAPQQATLATISKVPLVNTPEVDSGALAKALQSGVSTSGVFYESHLLQWAEGTLNAETLGKEPQANFPVQSKPVLTDPNAAPNAALTNNQEKTNLIAARDTSNATLSLPKEAIPIIQQQLQTLEQQRFVWQGELWPGQTMQWEVSRDSAGQEKNQQQEPTWQSAVHFELPELGAISAQLQLTGAQLRLTVNTPNAATASRLQSHANELTDALDNAGTKLEALLIKVRS
jgi:hypothetical protein